MTGVRRLTAPDAFVQGGMGQPKAGARSAMYRGQTPGQGSASHVPGQTPTSPLERDDRLSARVPFTHPAHRLRDLRELIPLLDHRPHLP